MMYKNTLANFSITVLIPLFNEEDNVVPITLAVDNVFKEIYNCNYEIFFVDDGSTDNTLAEVKKVAKKRSNIFYLSFSRNFGKDAALLAGFQHISSNTGAVITIDADLQHPPELIPELIKHWQSGYDVVYTYRNENNKGSSFFSKLSSKLFYRIISKLADVKFENGLSDFKLIDKKIVSVVKNTREEAPFFRGLFKWVGFNQIGIPYTAAARINGETKYPSKALVRLALHSITSFSTKPLTITIYIGFFTSFISVFYIPYVLYSFYKGYAISGWSSTIATIAFFGGVQLIVLGIIGLYLGKIFIQTKSRPQYIINESKYSASNSSTAQNEKNRAMDIFR